MIERVFFISCLPEGETSRQATSKSSDTVLKVANILVSKIVTCSKI